MGGVTLGSMIDAHAGRAGIVLGGGPSLPRQQELAREMYPSAVLASVNYHGCLLGCASYGDKHLMAMRRELGEKRPVIIEPEYACMIDDWRDFFPDLKLFRALTIEPRDGADIRVLEFPRGTGSSAMFCAWVLHMLGCSPVILCGIDCYEGGTYWHDPDQTSSGNSSVPQYHIDQWADRLPAFMPREIVRAAGGPLVELFSRIEPNLSIRVPPEHERELTLRFRRETIVGGRTYVEDDVDVFPYKQAQWLLIGDRVDLV